MVIFKKKSLAELRSERDVLKKQAEKAKARREAIDQRRALQKEIREAKHGRKIAVAKTVGRSAAKGSKRLAKASGRFAKKYVLPLPPEKRKRTTVRKPKKRKSTARPISINDFI